MNPEIIVGIIVTLTLLFLGFWIGQKWGRFRMAREWEEKIPSVRDEAVKRSRAVLSGQFSEQLAPYLPDFPFKPSEVTFLGKPVDFLVFRGSDQKNIEEVVFVEVKSGDAALSGQERRLRETILAKKVSWYEYKIPRELTNGRVH